MHGNPLNIYVQTTAEVIFTHKTLGLQPDYMIVA